MSEWKESDNSLEKTFTFESFPAAMQWMARAAVVIDQLDHHPEWTNVYNRVKVVLRTHSAGNTVTDLDRKLAKLLDEI